MVVLTKWGNFFLWKVSATWHLFACEEESLLSYSVVSIAASILCLAHTSPLQNVCTMLSPMVLLIVYGKPYVVD